MKRFTLIGSYAVGIAFCLFVFICAYVVFWPIDVLKNWNLSVEKTSYQVGESLSVDSTYQKVRSVTGISYRYLECKNGDRLVRYPMSEGIANRPSTKKTASQITVKIPMDVTDLPATCRVTINVDYQIYGFRSFSESAKTDFFMVTPITTPNNPNNVPRASSPTSEVPSEETDNAVVENSPKTPQVNNTDTFSTSPMFPRSVVNTLIGPILKSVSNLLGL